MPPRTLHEPLPPNPRPVGVGLALLCALLYLRSLFHGSPQTWFVIGSGLLMLLALRFPRFFYPATFILHTMGKIIQRITVPILFAIVYAVAVVPVATLLALLGRRPFPVGFDGTQRTYWEQRQDRRIASFTKQF